LKQNVDISAPIMSRFDLFFVVLDECDEVVDYNIAQHIVNIHKSMGHEGLAVQPDFTTDELQTYIRFARTLKPKITKESRELLIESYVMLRDADGNGAAKSSYRMTVRQLESMVRLAEARARLDLEENVLPNHVKEAARLLSKSIVHIKQKDVDLADFGDDGEGEGGNDGNDGDDNDGGDGGEGGDEAVKKMDETSEEPEELTLNYLEYQRISNMIVMHMRREEDKKEAAGETAGEARKDLIDWYVAEVTGNKDQALADSRKTTRLVRCIINRLVSVDNVLLQVGNDMLDADDQLLMVHPNYNMEDDPSSQILEDEEITQRTESMAASDDDDNESVNTRSSATELSQQTSTSLLGAPPSSQAAPTPEKSPVAKSRKSPRRGASASASATEARRSTRSTPKK